MIAHGSRMIRADAVQVERVEVWGLIWGINNPEVSYRGFFRKDLVLR